MSAALTTSAQAVLDYTPLFHMEHGILSSFTCIANASQTQQLVTSNHNRSIVRLILI